MSLTAILIALVLLILVCGAGYIMFWAVDQIGLPPPMIMLAKAVVAIVVIVLVIWALGSVPGLGFPKLL